MESSKATPNKIVKIKIELGFKSIFKKVIIKIPKRIGSKFAAKAVIPIQKDLNKKAVIIPVKIMPKNKANKTKLVK